MRFGRSAWLLGLLALLLVGCGGPGGPAGPKPIGELGPAGGWLDGPDGLAVAAPGGAIAGTISVFLAAASPPPLAPPPGWTRRSGFYRVFADRYLPAVDYFLLVLPIPEGADAAHLALAFYRPGGEPHAPAPVWGFLPGVVLPGVGFAALLPGLPDEGLTFALVEHPDFDSPSVTALGAAPLSLPPPGKRWLSQASVRAWPKGSISSATVSAFKSAVGGILNLYKNSRLRPPLLPVVGVKPVAKKGRPPVYDYSQAKYFFWLVPAGNGSGGCGSETLGYYSRKTHLMVICVPPDGSFSALMRRTLIHELFHAVQARYGKGANWWAESTAALSENSMQAPGYAPALTPDYGPRKEKRALTAFGGTVHYRTQDWWYFLLKKRGLAFDVGMDAFMQKGMNVKGTDAALGGKLADLFFDWVQDQAYVKGPATARPATACRVDAKTVSAAPKLVGDAHHETHVDSPNPHAVLSGAVFTYALGNPEPFPLSWWLWFSLGGDPLGPGDRGVIDVSGWGCNFVPKQAAVTLNPGQHLESGAIAANAALAKALDDKEPLASGKRFRLHARPIRGKVRIEGPAGGLNFLIRWAGSPPYQTTVSKAGDASGTYLLDLPVGTYDIDATNPSGYRASYRGVRVEDGKTAVPSPSPGPGREVVFLGRENGGAANLFLWDLDRGTVRRLTAFADDTWADPGQNRVYFAAARRQDGTLVVVLLQTPLDASRDTALYTVDPSVQQAVLRATLPRSQTVTQSNLRVNLDYDWSPGGPRAIRVFIEKKTVNGNPVTSSTLEAIDLATGSVVERYSIPQGGASIVACTARPGKDGGGYLVACEENDGTVSTHPLYRLPAGGGAPQTLAANLGAIGPERVEGLKNGLVFVNHFYGASSDPLYLDPGTGRVSQPAVHADVCYAAGDRNQVYCEGGDVWVFTIARNGDGRASVTKTESFKLPSGYSYANFGLLVQEIDPVERLEAR